MKQSLKCTEGTLCVSRLQGSVVEGWTVGWEGALRFSTSGSLVWTFYRTHFLFALWDFGSPSSWKSAEITARGPVFPHSWSCGPRSSPLLGGCPLFEGKERAWSQEQVPGSMPALGIPIEHMTCVGGDWTGLVWEWRGSPWPHRKLETFIFLNLFGCPSFLLQHGGSSSLTSDRTWVPSIWSMES